MQVRLRKLEHNKMMTDDEDLGLRIEIKPYNKKIRAVSTNYKLYCLSPCKRTNNLLQRN